MSPAILRFCCVCCCFVADVSLVYILQAGDWLGQSLYPTQTFFSAYITISYLHQDSVQHNVLGLSE